MAANTGTSGAITSVSALVDDKIVMPLLSAEEVNAQHRHLQSLRVNLIARLQQCDLGNIDEVMQAVLAKVESKEAELKRLMVELKKLRLQKKENDQELDDSDYESDSSTASRIEAEDLEAWKDRMQKSLHKELYTKVRALYTTNQAEFRDIMMSIAIPIDIALSEMVNPAPSAESRTRDNKLLPMATGLNASEQSHSHYSELAKKLGATIADPKSSKESHHKLETDPKYQDEAMATMPEESRLAARLVLPSLFGEDAVDVMREQHEEQVAKLHDELAAKRFDLEDYKEKVLELQNNVGLSEMTIHDLLVEKSNWVDVMAEGASAATLSREIELNNKDLKLQKKEAQLKTKEADLDIMKNVADFRESALKRNEDIVQRREIALANQQFCCHIPGAPREK